MNPSWSKHLETKRRIVARLIAAQNILELDNLPHSRIFTYFTDPVSCDFRDGANRQPGPATRDGGPMNPIESEVCTHDASLIVNMADVIESE